MKQISLNVIDYDIKDINPIWWKKIISLFLKPQKHFEIRCWRQEKYAINQALMYGTLCQNNSTPYEVSITGVLNKEIINQILNTPISTDYNRTTDFFTVNIDDNFCSTHYGSEIYIYDLTDDIVDAIKEIILPNINFFSLGIDFMSINE